MGQLSVVCARPCHPAPALCLRLLAPRPRVRRVIHLGQVLKVEPCVDLRGRDVGVAQQLLHRTQVATALQQVAGERVAQHVRVHGRGQPRLLAALAQAQSDRLRREPLAALADEQCGVKPR